MKTEKELSEENRPPYLKWLWKNKKTEITLTLVGIIACIFGTPVMIDSYLDGAAIIPVIGGFIAIYGFTIGMMLQPMLIYKKLRKLNYWSPNSPWSRGI
jgi:uncharacterized membrane protein